MLLHIISFAISFERMSKIPKGDSLDKAPNKNIKNIYIHKINSLMKISRDNLVDDEVDMMHTKT